MAIYVFIPQEIIEDGDDIVAEAHEVDGVNGGKVSGDFCFGICMTNPSSYGYSLKYFK